MRFRSTIFNFIFYFLFTAILPSAGLAQYGVGDTAADFTLLDLEGNQVSLYDNLGDVVLLNFFQTG